MFTFVTALLMTGWFSWAPYGQSLYSDSHPDAFRIDFSAVTMNGTYDYGSSGKSWQLHTFGTFGANIPLYHTEIKDDKFGFNVTWPMSATLWMDIFEPATSAVVNTDYRIGTPALCFIHRLSKDKWLKNYSISLNPFKHESTHAGDELTLARSDGGYALRRVNVSYNYAELRFTLNEPENPQAQTHTFRASLMIPLQLDKGWYFVEERDGEIEYIQSSSITVDEAGRLKARGPKINIPELALQYQWQSKTGPKSGAQGIISVECRMRARYGYNLGDRLLDPSSAGPDTPSFCVNSFFGVRFNSLKGKDGYFRRSAFGLRAYWGNCPYGEFRSIPGFSQIGLCLIFQ